MAGRRIVTYSNEDNKHAAVVYYESGNAEYYVTLTVDGKKKPEATYYTDDKEDACSTAKAMCGL